MAAQKPLLDADTPPLPVSMVRDAAHAATAAQQRAGVEIRELDAVADFKAASQVFQDIWGKNEDLGPPLNADLLRALSHAGNYVAAAFDGDGMRGALVGFLGTDKGHLHLHSHILGVLPRGQAGGAGFALKLHQRAWALGRDIETMQWTFDPLVRRNAYFNLTKLGARINRYLVNFYGVMDDSQNGQEESDRILLQWDLLADRTVAAAAGGSLEAERLNVNGLTSRTLAADEAGAPVVSSIGDAAEVLLLEVPDDIVALRRSDPSRARQWRIALRQALGEALQGGFRCEGMTRAGDYVLLRD